MTPAEFSAALAILGWSLRELARRLGCDVALPARWSKGTAFVPQPIAAWLRKLAAGVGRQPVPEWRVRAQ